MSLMRTAGLTLAVLALVFVAVVSGKNPEAEVANQPAVGEGMTSFLLVAIPALGFAFGMYWWQKAAEVSIDPAKMGGRNSF
eukprot:CAMPEP_0174828616 /NCGR_PEP_ID=MMETSP1114-20130205/1443_1 /TAXON_ID=312471 /ORGANISM="Neobodo designis, Strain CCAP 1951/1" /LENGTH=80 /DNA_ID=CAMNT_0016062339 /DNA_START=223 /DNA_END=462 /DNA_ORIENTATION=+